MITATRITIRMSPSTGSPARLNGPLSLALALMVPALLGASSANAQVSSNTCGTLAANKYPVNATCVPRAFNTTGFSATSNPGGCNSSLRKDAYGWFTATSTLTTVRYTPTGGADAILHVLSACGGIVLGCSDGALGNGTETVTIPTVIGTNYFVRVQRYNSNANMNGNLCIFSPDCLYTLNLYDSFGDGWADFSGTAYVEIIVGGVSLGLWTLPSGASGSIDFGVSNGQTVEIIYNDGSAWYYYENSMELTVGGQCVFQSYEPPNIGVTYTTIADCAPSTAALPQDCMGGTTICDDGSIHDNNATTGCVMDLNASNSGCLLNYERQGSWYYFSPSVGGTLGFTLVPTGATDDYDFALWGPYDAVQCPNNAPVRCSYFDGMFYSSTTTGMGNGATDASEGAGPPPATNNGWVQTLNVIADKVYVLYIDNWSSTGQAFDLTWQLSGGASLDCTTLPVELLDLQATTRGTVIDVNWATATERNSDYFDVQRSADNEHFTTIGTVGAAGDAQYRNDYLFVDEAPLQGANYYRLRQVDRDGTVDITRTVVAFMSQGSGDRPVIFPNPATDVLNVAFGSPLEGSAVLYVQDAVGRTIAESTVVVLRGEQTAVVPTDKLSLGWYNLSIALPNGSILPCGGFLRK